MTPTIHHLEDGKVEISTTRLLMRAARDNDSAAVHQAFSDPEVMQYWSTLAHTSEDQTRAWIQTMTQSALNGDTDFVVCLKPDFRPVGKIGAWQDHEIGFMLVRSLWGQGLAQEALGAVIPYLFFEKGFSEITADTDPRNAACIALLQKMGFVVYASQEKTWEVGGEWVDSLYFKLARESWQTPRDHRQGHQST